MFNLGRYTVKKAFTLIELLVVVLIIGILAAIALPQYRVAVKKAKMTEYMNMVKAIRDAEEVHYLANGYYTNDLESLDVSTPSKGNCEFKEDTYCSVYECGDDWYGVCNDGANAQAGTKEWHEFKLRYLHVLRDWEHSSTTYHKGDVICMAIGEVEHKVCKSIGGEGAIPSNTNTEKCYLVK